MEITAAQVKELREQTGAPMMDCKRALVEKGGDFEAAKQYLRERGAAVQDKRAERHAAAGVVAGASTPDHKKAVLVELNCETDFVARNEEFVALAAAIAQAALAGASAGADKEALGGLSLDGTSVEASVDTIRGKIGEKIEIGKVVVRETSGILDTYIHHDRTKGVMVEVEGNDSDAVVEAAHKIATHIAWADPEFITKDQVDPERVRQEIEIEMHRAINEGKPEAQAEKIAEGRVNKNFFQKACLMEQHYLGQPETIKQLLEAAKGDGGEPRVTFFTRIAVGA
ncbi:MAG: elongation factor Ts [Fimbriimonadales bacterium]